MSSIRQYHYPKVKTVSSTFKQNACDIIESALEVNNVPGQLLLLNVKIIKKGGL